MHRLPSAHVFVAHESPKYVATGYCAQQENSKARAKSAGARNALLMPKQWPRSRVPSGVVDPPAAARQASPRMTRLVAALALALAVPLGAGVGGCTTPRVNAPTAPADDSPPVTTLSPDASPITLRRSVIADEYFWLRAKALESEVPAPFGDALAAMQAIRADLSGDPTAWEDLEVPLGVVETARDLRMAYEDLPETRAGGGRGVPLRARAVSQV